MQAVLTLKNTCLIWNRNNYPFYRILQHRYMDAVWLVLPVEKIVPICNLPVSGGMGIAFCVAGGIMAKEVVRRGGERERTQKRKGAAKLRWERGESFELQPT